MSNNNAPQNIIEIEISAEKVYYTIIGRENGMDILLQDIKEKNRTNTIYFISKLIIPLANLLDNFIDKNVILSNDCEWFSVQFYAIVVLRKKRKYIHYFA